MPDPTSRIEPARVESASYRDSDSQRNASRKEKRQQRRPQPEPGASPLPEIAEPADKQQEYVDQSEHQPGDDQLDHEKHELDTMA